MRHVVLTVAFCFAAAAMLASASAATCSDQAADKKLAGAAMKSFMGKCKKDAETTCVATAQDKKLSGAAKTSFTKKCVADAVGSH
jgi:hypothetical protein